MGTKYSSVTVTGYNASPPPDDDTTTASNQVQWSKHTGKIGDPLKTAVESIDAKLLTLLDEGPVTKTGTYTTTLGDYAKVVQVNGTFSVHLMDAASAGAGYKVTIKNSGGGTVTVDTATPGDQIDGDTSAAVGPGGIIAIMVNEGADGYMSMGFVQPLGLVGAVSDFAGSAIPAGYLDCNGANVARNAYPALFVALGTTWGVGDGSTTFGLPDLRRRATVGAGGTGTGTLGNLVGKVGGSEYHTLSLGETPAHSHAGSTAASGGGGAISPTVTTSGDETGLLPTISASDIQTGTTLTAPSHTHSLSITSAGSGGAHNNMQPSAVVRKIIKAL